MGINPKLLEYFLRTKELERRTVIIKEGSKVKLDIKNMQDHPNWNKNLDYNKTRHHKWVMSHKDDVFTVEYDPQYIDNPTLVCLSEDQTKPKWLFWIGDLIRLDEEV